MPKYVIERDIPGAGTMTSGQLTAVSPTSCGVLRKLSGEPRPRSADDDRSHALARMK